MPTSIGVARNYDGMMTGLQRCDVPWGARGPRQGGWCSALREDQTASCPLNRAMNWVKLTLGDATVAVCKMQPAPPRALLPDSGRGVSSAPGCRALDPGAIVVVTSAQRATCLGRGNPGSSQCPQS